MANINYEIQCPATVSTAAKKVDIGLTINSLKFKKILPRKIIEKDNNIEVMLRDGIFNFTNKSSSYIEVNSVSFYYNGKIASLYNMSKELPPASEQNLTYLNRFPLEKNALDFLNVTKKMALKKNLNFGIAIKYRILDTNKEITLYQNNKYSLLELI